MVHIIVINVIVRYLQAKAALQAGFRKGNARERPVINRHEKESHEQRVSGVNSPEIHRYSKISFLMFLQRRAVLLPICSKKLYSLRS
jgi:hypothetical protein